LAKAEEAGSSVGMAVLLPFPSPGPKKVGSACGRIKAALALKEALAISLLLAGGGTVDAAAAYLELRKGLVADRTSLFLQGLLASRHHFVQQLLVQRMLVSGMVRVGQPLV
jgi:hypothetical protein